MITRENTKNVIFDLDGTLINSYQGIQLSYNYAFKQIYHFACNYTIEPFIGPPIKEIFVKLTGETDIEKINIFVKKFQEKYDSEFYMNCNTYTGTTELLTFLSDERLSLYIATNKRNIPTKLILDHLTLNQYFKKVYAVDSGYGFYNSKVDMVADLIEAENLETSKTILIGDTLHDKLAAEKNNINFVYAAYGYGNLADEALTIKNTLEIINLIK